MCIVKNEMYTHEDEHKLKPNSYGYGKTQKVKKHVQKPYKKKTQKI